MSLNLKIVRVNSWMEKMYSKEGKLTGRKCYEVYQKRDTPCPWCPSLKTIETGGTHNAIMPYPSEENPDRWIGLSSFPLRNIEGDMVGVIEYAKDITDRKRAEEEIKSNEARFRELFNNMRSGVAVYEAKDNGNDFIFKDFNRAGEQIEKIKKENVIGESVLEIFPGVKKFGLFDVFKRVWETGKPEHYPISLYKDARIVGWRENFVYKLPSGEIVAVYDDVTERKQAEEALRESVEKFREMAELLPEIVFECDVQGNITFANKAAFERFSYTQEDFDKGVNALKFIVPDDRERAGENIEKILRGIERDSLEYTALRKNGSEFPVIIYSSPIIRGGKPIGLRGIIVDITDRKQAEEAMRESEKKYRSMMNAMKDLIYICSPDYLIEYMNPAMIRSLGRDATGEKCFKAIHDLDEICAWCMHSKMFLDECFEYDIVSPRSNRHYKVTTSPIVHEDGSISKMTVYR
ncbi:MAG: PAS domain S-box protein, partial [Deltaproteobacteria bacterium]|nr:PAS domain S-box protein [Deltaproteobacteria bacterium]